MFFSFTDKDDFDTQIKFVDGSTYLVKGGELNTKKFSQHNESILKRYTIHASGEIPWGACTITVHFTIVIEWDGNIRHLPQVISTQLSGMGMSCNRGGSSCLPTLDSFVYDESTGAFSNLVFSSSCINESAALSDPTVKTAIEQILNNAIAESIQNP